MWVCLNIVILLLRVIHMMKVFFLFTTTTTTPICYIAAATSRLLLCVLSSLIKNQCPILSLHLSILTPKRRFAHIFFPPLLFCTLSKFLLRPSIPHVTFTLSIFKKDTKLFHNNIEVLATVFIFWKEEHATRRRLDAVEKERETIYMKYLHVYWHRLSLQLFCFSSVLIRSIDGKVQIFLRIVL